MAKKPTITTVGSSAVYSSSQLNSNFKALQDAFEDVVGRDGEQGENNSMTGQLNADLKRVINVPDPVEDTDAANKRYADGAPKEWSDQAKDWANTAKDWAIKDDDPVDSGLWSSKHYAEESATNADIASNKAGEARDWATKLGDTVDGTEYSSKKYAQDAASSANAASSSATAASDAADDAKSWAYETIKHLPDYDALRAMVRAEGQEAVYVDGEGIAGMFQYDAGDTTTPDNGGTVIVGADGERWKRAYENLVNVLWFGAIGNGIHDDTVAFQSAIDSAPAIFIPKRVYLLSASVPYIQNAGDRIAAIEIPSNRSLVFEDGAVVKSTDYTGGRDYRAIFTLITGTDVHISGGVMFDGELNSNASNGPVRPKVAIVLNAAKNCSITGCRAKNFYYHGFAAYASQEGGGCENVTFKDLVSDNGRSDSIIAYSSYANYQNEKNRRIYIINCEGKNSGLFFGVEMRGCVDSEIIGGHYSGNNTGGIDIEEGCENISIKRLKTSDNGANGIIISGNQGACKNIKIEDVIATRNTGAQITNIAGNGMHILRCILTNGGSNGVDIALPTTLPVGDGAIIEDSVITNNSGIGFQCRGTNAEIRNSQITNNTIGDVQVSNSGFRRIGSTIGSTSFDSGSREILGSSYERDSSENASCLNIFGHITQTNQKVSLRAKDANSTLLGSLDFINPGGGDGNVEIYGRAAGTRQKLATIAASGDIEIEQKLRGVVLKDSNGGRWRIVVDTNGTLSTTAL